MININRNFKNQEFLNFLGVNNKDILSSFDEEKLFHLVK